MTRVVSGRLTPLCFGVSHADARRSWSEREGLALELRSRDAVGVGEASPLPGYSRDDLATCRAELSGCWERVGALDVDAPVRETLRDAVARAGVRAPAAIFALETALLDLISRARSRPAWAVLRGEDAARPVPLSALCKGDSPEELAESAARAVARGIGVVKVKIGGPSALERDPPRLAAIRARLGEEVGLRLDANQALPEGRLEEALALYASFSPELLEEPAPPSAFDALTASPVPLAMDESLMDEGWRARLREAASRGTCAAVVLKPMALGGILRSLDVAEAARDAGLASLVTHLVDGPVASAATACLALALPGRVMPCGLDAHGRLDRPLASLGPAHVIPFAEPGIACMVEGAG